MTRLPIPGMGTMRNAMLIAFALIALAGACAWERPAKAISLDKVACYVALANDLTPLLDARMADAAARTPECASDGGSAQAANANGATRITTPRPTAPPTMQQRSATNGPGSVGAPVTPPSAKAAGDTGR